MGGEPRTFESLVELRLDRGFRLACAILGDDREAEDALQDACLTAWDRRRSLRDTERFDAWFDRILINRCRDGLRARQRQRVRAIALEARARLEVGGSASVESDLALDEAVDALDADHRIVVLLRYWQDLPLEGIAERLGVPLGTVKSRLHYALRGMRAKLEAGNGRA